jgi:ATP-dependent Clp protease ATP-binding subunit ClpA
MFERFTREARAAVVRAREAARWTGAEQVEPEHLLLALAGGDGADAAARAFAEAGIDARTIEKAIEQDLVAALQVVGVPAAVVEATPAHPRADMPGFGAAAKAALEDALREAVRLGDRRIRSGHLLLGVLRQPPPSVHRVLGALNVTPRRLADLVQVELASRRP